MTRPDDTCVLGCWLDCPRECPCDCHRGVSSMTGAVKPPVADGGPPIDMGEFTLGQELCAACFQPVPGVHKTGCPLAPTVVLLNAEFDVISKPRHYNVHPSGVECIEITRCMTFMGGNAFKYVFRDEEKNGAQDLSKSIQYLLWCIEHADLIWLPWKKYEGLTLLNRVVEAETDHNRIQFYEAMMTVRRDIALNAVIRLADQV